MRKNYTVSKFLALVLFFCMLVTVSVSAFAGDWRLPWQKEPEAVHREPEMKLYAKCEPVAFTPDNINLTVEGAAFGDARKLLDHSEQTVFTAKGKSATVTMDLGAPHMLGAVRILPKKGEKENVNRCMGTKFSVSEDNKTFYPVMTVEPIDNDDYPEGWRSLELGGAGYYRYLRMEIPADAAFGEIEWMEYPEWNYVTEPGKAERSISLRLYPCDVKKKIEGRLVAAVYNVDGVMKAFSVTDCDVAQTTEYIDVTIPGIDRETGDNYRILVWDKDGTPVLERPLNYHYTAASKAFSIPNVFSDDMIIQAGKPFKIWGTAPIGSTITAHLENMQGGMITRTATVKSGSDWEMDLGSYSAGGNYLLTVECGGTEKRFDNIIFGDVWLLVGQSNMNYFMESGKDTRDYLKSDAGRQEVNNTQIRLLNLWSMGEGGAGEKVSMLPIQKTRPAWSMMNYQAAQYCPAIGYFFAQEIQKDCKVPVGIIGAAVGDTEINRWIPYGMDCGSFSATDGNLFYNRVAPFEKLQIKGILMYQGEADEYRTHLSTEEYRDAMSSLVNYYRSIWGENTPFYWTQVTRHQGKDTSLIREGQRLALYKLKNPENAGVISLLDLYGEYDGGTGSCRDDIHPHQKKEVAQRFLRYVKHDVYGQNEIVPTGPVYQSCTADGKTLTLTFNCTGSLSVMPKSRYADKKGMDFIAKSGKNEGQPQCFEVAGEDGVYYEAKAKISGNTVTLQSDKVSAPKSARYAWGAYPEMPNLTDGSGLPALSFCTEN